MSKKISLKEAMSIGIGGMVGGGIFAVLGLAVSLAKGATPISFLIAGIIALLTSYSYAKLSNTFPDRGGTVKFINVAFGKTIFSGTVNNLLWISYIIMLSLYASAFGSYAPNLFKIFESSTLNFHFYASFIIILATAINYYSIAVVSKIESISVIIKLLILLSFIIIGSYGLVGNENLSQFSIDNWENSINIIAAGMVIFVAYEGFELIANAAPDIKNPDKNISKAYYYSVIFVIILYVIIAIVTIGSLPFNKIATAEDYVLAEAAKPMLGKIGFTIITIAALISTFSAINASLYGGSRVSFEIAEDDELPHAFTSVFWNQPIGLLITAILTLIVTNTLNLESISTAGSIGFLSIFAIVNFAGYRLSSKMNSKKLIHLTGFIVCLIALVVLIIQQFKNNKLGIIVSFSIIFGCFLLEFVYKRKLNQN
ncbi:amino acid permease [Polaribacter haliotis]|uniref:Amino acid permease n=1 Tax=Polaribacter haliotis TaxID=1888915 RepID=A0A7L8AGW2_9FLAO|nr:APC family permease [Polaribacter haliotis]QOD61210.1 amino acid permease [Polaribacter haliotis]